MNKINTMHEFRLINYMNKLSKTTIFKKIQINKDSCNIELPPASNRLKEFPRKRMPLLILRRKHQSVKSIT